MKSNTNAVLKLFALALLSAILSWGGSCQQLILC